MSARTHKGTCLSFLPSFGPIIGTLSHENALHESGKWHWGDGQDGQDVFVGVYRHQQLLISTYRYIVNLKDSTLTPEN